MDAELGGAELGGAELGGREGGGEGEDSAMANELLNRKKITTTRKKYLFKVCPLFIKL